VICFLWRFRLSEERAKLVVACSEVSRVAMGMDPATAGLVNARGWNNARDPNSARMFVYLNSAAFC